MRPNPETIRGCRSLIALTLVAAAEALALDRQTAPTARTEPPEPERRIVVSIPDCKLALIENGRVVKIYRTAVGAPSSPTPAGTYTIQQRVPNPAWYGPGGKVVRPGRGNPVGTRWIGLSRKGYGIHGTNSPASIGHHASHGCVRLRNRDVEDLFARVSVGDVVELHGERDGEIAAIFGGTSDLTVVAAGFAAGGGQ